ncbi:MAG: protein-L-isoaspartate(D-aspartate) O-methyltransferase [Planctomycetes bacterium]|nr:protein-L-isoaspartate(D-aspartate) O-methyltransferase [Planctomycetota bacterium]
MQPIFRLISGILIVTLMAPVCAQAADNYAALRDEMVRLEIEAAGIDHPGVLRSMRTTPRHLFVLGRFRQQAYLDAALPIGDRQTISPPFVVAYMTQELDPKPTDRVLEIGTGSGYQAAVLSPLVSEVFTIEIVEPLGRRAQRTLKRLRYDNVHARVGDGFQGWPEEAPFDKIMVTCSPEDIPERLVEQLKEGGTMIIPVGERYQQNLFRITKRDGKLHREALRATLFVPMTGAAEEARQVLPNPKSPSIVNGNFSSRIDNTDLPTGWHYLRNARIVSETERYGEPSGFLSFENSEPGQPSRALQGVALDGRAVSFVKLSARVRGKNLQPGPTTRQRAAVIITFYDKRRAVIDSQQLANWKGTFDWRLESKKIRVPLATREAIVRVGLLGGVGHLDIDDLRLEVVTRE